MGKFMIKKFFIEGMKMACELLSLEICNCLYEGDDSEASYDWEVTTWCEFPGAVNQDDETKRAFIETLNMYLLAASLSGKWELDSNRDDLGIEVICDTKMILHLIKVEG